MAQQKKETPTEQNKTPNHQTTALREAFGTFEHASWQAEA